MPRPFVCSLCALVAATVAPRATAHLETAETRAELDKFIAEFPREPTFYLRRAELRMEHSEWTGARSDLDRAAALAPGSIDVARARGRVALEQGDPVAAAKQFDTVLRLAPTDREALILRARTRALLGENAGAYADYSQAIALLASPSPDLFLARAALALPPETALHGLDQGIERLGPVAPLLERALAIELQLGRTDAALARLDQIAATAERKETYWKRRGDILAAAGRPVAAREAYRRALTAIEALPTWLRDTPAVTQLTTELRRVTGGSS